MTNPQIKTLQNPVHLITCVFLYLLCEGAMPGGQRFIENM